MDPTTTPAPTGADSPAPAPAPPPVVRGSTTGESFMAPTATPAAGSASAAPATPAPAAKPAPGRLALSQADLKERIARARAGALRDVFGTDDTAAIKAKLERADALESQAEEQRLAQMTESQKQAHELTQARAEAAKYRSQLAVTREREVVRDQGQMVTRIASQHVNPQAIEEASLAFARKVATTDPKIVAKWTEGQINGWFKRYVTTKPFMARAAAPAPEMPPRRVVSSPGGATRAAPRPSAPSTSQTNGAKTFRPGQPNSMSRAEAREEAKRRGIQW